MLTVGSIKAVPVRNLNSGKIDDCPPVTIVSPSLTGANFEISVSCTIADDLPFQTNDPI